MTPIRIQSKLFEVRDQIHLIHLNTNSYAEHKALDTFYDEWLDLVDTFIEIYQGKYGRIGGVVELSANSGVNARQYLVELMKWLNSDIQNIISEEDTDLENTIADMKGLVNRTLYLLTLK